MQKVVMVPALSYAKTLVCALKYALRAPDTDTEDVVASWVAALPHLPDTALHLTAHQLVAARFFLSRGHSGGSGITPFKVMALHTLVRLATLELEGRGAPVPDFMHEALDPPSRPV